MTKKHFEAIAKILSQWADRNNDIRWQSYKDLVEEFAVYLKHQNPLFDTARFFEACKIRYTNPCQNIGPPQLQNYLEQSCKIGS